MISLAIKVIDLPFLIFSWDLCKSFCWIRTINVHKWTALRNDDAELIFLYSSGVKFYCITLVEEFTMLFCCANSWVHKYFVQLNTLRTNRKTINYDGRENIETNISKSFGKTALVLCWWKYILEIKLNDVFISIKIFIWHKTERSFLIKSVSFLLFPSFFKDLLSKNLFFFG